MKLATRETAMMTLGLTCTCLLGCPVVFSGGLTGSATPAPCTADADCPDGIACLFPNGSGQPGICDVDETTVSTGVPAPCNGDGDCPEGIACVFADGVDRDGFCDVDETQAP